MVPLTRGAGTLVPSGFDGGGVIVLPGTSGATTRLPSAP
jgi:hypothetical protein